MKIGCLFCLFPLIGGAMDGTCLALLRGMANQSRSNDPIFVFAGYVEEGGLGPSQERKGALIPVLVHRDDLIYGAGKPDELEENRVTRNAHLLGDPAFSKTGWLSGTRRRARRLRDDRAIELLFQNFLVEIRIPEEGVDPFAILDAERTAFPYVPGPEDYLHPRFPINRSDQGPYNNARRLLRVLGTEFVKEGHFVKLPTGQLGITRISGDPWMMDVPVTQLQWAMVMGSNPSSCTHSSFTLPRNCFLRIGEDPVEAHHPVNGVTGSEIREFLRRLNQLSSSWQYRLPTADEWEYAARAGSSQHYVAPRASNSVRRVGSFEPNAWGLYDVHGNVEERTSTTYPHGTTLYVTKGGWTGDRFATLHEEGYSGADAPVTIRKWTDGLRLMREKRKQ